MNKSLLHMLVTGVVLGLLCACTSIDELKATKAKPLDTQRDGPVNVASHASGIDSNKVGKTTVLFVPVGAIRAEGDTSANIMKGVRSALAAVGYNDTGASYRSREAGYLKAHVEEVKFGNFIFSTWGTIVVQLRLETRDGALLWEKRIRSSVSLVVNNYDRTAKVTMNRLVKDMSKAFVEEDFYLATQRVKRHNAFLEEQNAAPERRQTRTPSK